MSVAAAGFAGMRDFSSFAHAPAGTRHVTAGVGAAATAASSASSRAAESRGQAASHNENSQAPRPRRRRTPRDEDALDRDELPPSAAQLVLIERVAVAHVGDLVLVSVEGSHFLWKMVRRMVGVLVEVGKGTLEPSVVTDLLAERSTVPALNTAPPSGLFLERVYYQGDRRAPETPTPAFPLPASAQLRSNP
jgi:hypothetical protein